MPYIPHQSEAAAAAFATAELILAIQKEFPQVRIVPCEPIEGEDIHLWAYIPMQPEEHLLIQDRIIEMKHVVQEKSDVQTVVLACAEADEAGVGLTPPQD